MTPSQQAKAAGFKSLAEVSRLSGVPRTTLKRWHRDNPKLFAGTLRGFRVMQEQAL